MVRAASAYVLSRFPEHAPQFGPSIRSAAEIEPVSLARAGMLWCLGSLRDGSQENLTLLDASLGSADLRQAVAAASALYRIKGSLWPSTLPLYQQLAAATWFAEGFLAGVPWGFAAADPMEEVTAELDPDPAGATRSLLGLMSQADDLGSAYSSIMHDLLAMNFPDGNWRKCARLTDIQQEVIRRLVETPAVWEDSPGTFFFLFPDCRSNLSKLSRSDVQKARESMQESLRRAGRH